MGRQSRVRAIRRALAVKGRGAAKRAVGRTPPGVVGGPIAGAVVAAAAELNRRSFPMRTDLPPLPERMKSLTVSDRGYPVPWFVAWADGKPEFRIADAHKLVAAVKESRCWVCGGFMAGEKGCFVLGPMCTVNRVSAEPPSHRECAEYSVRACPFLAKPHMTRREGALLVDPAECGHAGEMLAHNPGVSAVWETTQATYYPADGGVLFEIGDPVRVDWYAEGRPATRAEVEAAVARGLPRLDALCDEDDDPADSRRVLAENEAAARKFWPEV